MGNNAALRSIIRKPAGGKHVKANRSGAKGFINTNLRNRRRYSAYYIVDLQGIYGGSNV